MPVQNWKKVSPSATCGAPIDAPLRFFLTHSPARRVDSQHYDYSYNSAANPCFPMVQKENRAADSPPRPSRQPRLLPFRVFPTDVRFEYGIQKLLTAKGGLVTPRPSKTWLLRTGSRSI